MKLILPLVTLLGACFLLAPQAHSAPLGFAFSVEPIIGYERVHKLIPTDHTSDRLFYGARATAGIPLVAAEGEYTRGTDSETFTDPAMATKDTTDKFKVGARSLLGLGRFVSLIVRGGAQGSKNTHEDTVAGVTTTTSEPGLTFKPYAGLGFRFALTSKMAFSASITAVFRDFPNMGKNEYQTSAGYQISFP